MKRCQKLINVAKYSRENLSIVSTKIKTTFCIFVLSFFESIRSGLHRGCCTSVRISSFSISLPPLSLPPFSLALPYPSLLRNWRSERSRRVQYTTGVSARKVVEKRWWEKHAVGPNSARAACSRRLERRATQLNERVRLRNPKRERAAPEAEYENRRLLQFLSFSLFRICARERETFD